MNSVLECIVLECEAKKENRKIPICEAAQTVSTESWSIYVLNLNDYITLYLSE